jgi:hypothetical protein
LDPYSIGPVDPDLDSKSGSGSRKKFVEVHFLKCWIASFKGFFWNFDILYGGLGIGKLQFFIKKI